MAQKNTAECDGCNEKFDLSLRQGRMIPPGWIIIQTKKNPDSILIPLSESDDEYSYACSKACHILVLQALVSRELSTASPEVEGTVRRTILGS